MVAEPAPIGTEHLGAGYWGTLRPVTSATAVQAEILDVSGTFVPYSSYYWTDEWQESEREADDDIHAGRVRSFSSLDDFLQSLDEAEE